MKGFIKKVLLLLLCVSLAHPAAFARMEPLGPESFGPLLTLEEAVRKVLSSDSRVGEMLARVRKEEELFNAQRAQAFPRLGTELFQAFSTGKKHFPVYFDVTLEEPVFQGGKVRFGKKRQKVRIESEELRLEETKRELALEIRILYIEALRERELLKLAQEGVGEISERLHGLKRAHERGLNPRLEFLRMRLLLQQMKQELLRHKENQDHLVGLLKASCGIGERESLELEPLRNFPGLKSGLSFYLEASQARDPIRKLKTLEVEEKNYEKKILQAERFPEVSLVARWEMDRDVFIETNRAMGGVIAKWNIWDFGELGSRVKAKAHEAEETRLKGETEIREREKEIRTLFHSARIEQGKIKLARALIQERSEAYKNDKVYFIAGESGKAGIVQSLLELLHARMLEIEAWAEYRVICARLGRYTDFSHEGDAS